MSKEEVVDPDVSLLLIEVDEFGEEMRSPLRKRGKSPGSTSETDYESWPNVNQTEYTSPLKHLGKNNAGNGSSENLDESIVVIHEKIHHLTPSKIINQSRNELPASQDDSVIILSENEEEMTKELAKNHSSKITNSKNVRKRVHKPMSRLGAKIAAKRSPLRKKKRFVTRLQSISIDSEDENTNSNNDSSISESLPTVISIDNPPGIKTSVNMSNDVVEENKKDSDDRSHSSESASPSTATRDDVSVVWMAIKDLCTAEEERAALDSAAEVSKSKKCPVLCKDTKGDSPSLHRINAKSKLVGKSFKGKKKRQNPNWASYVKNSAIARAMVKEQNRRSNESAENAIGRCYSKEKPVKGPGSLRVIVIDGCNLAMAYTNGKYFSEEGLKLVIDYFKLRGHTVKAFVPQHKRSAKHNLLEKLYTDGIVAFTPSRRIGGKTISSYDDRYILDYATMCDGIVVSMDQYRDLYKEKPEWKNTIENRLLVPTFVGNCVMFPEDPLGRKGPKLEDFLRH